ncbi:hypothetical protein BDV96DRAFT_610652 [Lophiotrema nucula]|uniref:Chromatin modification-related protein n=1 Tax=Lophiotrema nucula TaxID=690887 RepID=A0A6A5ZHH7_9PLEO|nr:hypothetical protein BDV96DRAFT_610652 [Lophiotrema nucula]
MTPQPAANPDAQTTVNDFLDYTEFFPSDLVRSLRLIGNLDSTYQEATQTVHDLTKQYGRLQDIPANGRPEPTVLRRQISAALEKAIYTRESSYTEATRLYEVAERHCHRLVIIKRKLQALPQPPSRDPTPVPVSPQAARSLARPYERGPRLHLHFDPSRHGASRPRDRDRKSGVRRSIYSSDDSDTDSDARSANDVERRRLKLHTDKSSRAPKSSRARVSGAGTNVHSSIAGISTSNALARLSPPPPDAKPGSKHAPWFKLTEYEMAVLRKNMKKNAIWTPSDTMIRRELERKGRGHAAYEAEKARCENAGEELLDEEPDVPSVASIAPPANYTESNAAAAEVIQTPVDPPREKETQNDPKEAKRAKRESQREQAVRQAVRDAQELEDATKKIKEAAESLEKLNFVVDSANVTPVTQRRQSTTRASRKRKRDPTPPTQAAETPNTVTREPSAASRDSSTRPPDAKRIRLPVLQPLTPVPPTLTSSSVSESTPQETTPISTTPVATTPAVTTPIAKTPAAATPAPETPVPLPEPIKTTTVQVPLAPEGPATPKSAKLPPKAPSRQATPALTSPVHPKASEAKRSPTIPTPAPPIATAASSRPRRESVVPKAATPPDLPAEPTPPPKASTPAPEPAPEPTPKPEAVPTRPRSARGHVPTPKAQSEEPKLNEAGKPARELRRHSIFSQPAISAPTRTSTRRKPPPKGEITAGEEGQKTITNVKRASGSKNKKRKKPDEESDAVEDFDEDEPRYCICDDVSYGDMISCDNNCEKEWFHMECVNVSPNDLPSRRSKWYCPDCRQQMGTDPYGNPLVPPPLPGRRGNR